MVYDLVSDNLFRLKYAEYSRVKQMSVATLITNLVNYRRLQGISIAAHLFKNDIKENDSCKVRQKHIKQIKDFIIMWNVIIESL